MIYQEKTALLNITHEVLRHLIGLPEEIKIMGVETTPDDFGKNRFSVKIHHDCLPPNAEGAQIPRIDMFSLKEKLVFWWNDNETRP